MTDPHLDVDALTAAAAAVPGVRVQPDRRGRTVLVRRRGGTTTVEASVGLPDDRPALAAALDVVAGVRAALPRPEGTTVRVRIVSVG